MTEVQEAQEEDVIPAAGRMLVQVQGSVNAKETASIQNWYEVDWVLGTSVLKIHYAHLAEAA